MVCGNKITLENFRHELIRQVTNRVREYALSAVNSLSEEEKSAIDVGAIVKRIVDNLSTYIVEIVEVAKEYSQNFYRRKAPNFSFLINYRPPRSIPLPSSPRW